MADPSMGYQADGTDIDLPFDNLSPSQQAKLSLDRLGQDPVTNAMAMKQSPLQGDLTGGAAQSINYGMAPQTAIDASPGAAPGRSTVSEGPANPAPFVNPSDLAWGGQQVSQPATPPPVPPPAAPAGHHVGGGGGSDLAQLQAGNTAQKAAELSMGDIKSQQAIAEQKILNSGLTEEQKSAAWQQVHADEMEQFVKQQQATTQKMMENFRATSKVNPNAYWDDMSTGAKVGNALALALSGFGAGISGQPNMAQQVITQGVKDNIDAQVHNIQTKRLAIDDQNNMVAQYMKNGMDISEAKHAALATQMQMIKDRVVANAAGYASPMAKQQSIAAAGSLDQATAKAASDLRTASMSRAATAQNMKYQAANEEWTLQNRRGLYLALGGQGPIDTANPEIAAHAVRLPDNTVALAASPEDAKTGRDIVAAGVQYHNALQRVHQAVSQYTDVIPHNIPGTAGKERQEAANQAIAEAQAAAHQYFKVRGSAGAVEEEGGVGPNLLQELSGAGTLGGFAGTRKAALDRIQKLDQDHLRDMRDQLRANNIHLKPEADTSKRKPIGG